MRYLFRAGVKRRVMHITGLHPVTGEPTMHPLCGRDTGDYDRTINAPFALGRPVCKLCRRRAAA